MEEGFNKKSISIGEAANYLGVSIDTVRRWDSQGILHSTRPDGKNRYFSLNELEKIRYDKPLQIGEAAERLGISEATLRRLEEQGMIAPDRNSQGERLYTRECLKSFLDSDYYLRQKEVENKILDPEDEENDETDEERSTRLATQRKIINARVEEHHQKIAHLIIFRNVFYGTGLFLVTFLILSVIIIAILFLLNPQSTAQWFGYRVSDQTKVSSESKQVLGVEFQPQAKAEPKNIWAKILKPLSQISLGVVKEMDAATYYEIMPMQKIENVNDVLTVNSQNEIVSRFNFSFPDTSYLRIPDANLIKNLNADYLRGKVPGENPGDLAVINNDNFIEGLKITETDPVFNAWNKSTGISITQDQITDLTIPDPTETDPVFGTSTAGAITAADVINWDLAFGSSHNALTLGTANGLSLVGQELSLGLASAGVTGSLSGADWTTFNNKQNVLVFGDVTAGSTKITIGGTAAGAVVGAGLSVDVTEANVTHNNLAGLTTGDPHTQYALLVGRSGGQSLSGGTDANDDITIQGTTDATRTTSYVNLQPNGGNVGIGTATPNNTIQVSGLINFDNTDLNTKLGYQAGDNIVAGAVENTFVGYQAGRSASSGSTNAADKNTAVGYQSLYKNTTGDANTVIGHSAFYYNTTGKSSVAIGYSSLNRNTAGNYNTAIGYNAMWANTTGSTNTALGFNALQANTTGAKNIAIGYNALYDLKIIADDGTGTNTALGYNTGRGIITGVNNTILGANVTGLSATLSNNIIIADGSGNQRINVDSNGNVGIGTTGPDFKLDVSGALRIEGANQLYFGGTAVGDTLGNLYHDGTDFVFSDTIKPTGYKSSDGTSGLTSDITVKGSAGADCVLTFKNGLLTASTCP